jgi:hypothetical protein
MNYLDAYVKNVGKKLPGKIREDVEQELHSLILDTMEERYPDSVGSFTDEQQLTVLKEFDSPEKMAAQYAPPDQYLVGPKLFPVFKIAALAVMGALLLSTLVGYFAGMTPLPGGGFDWLALFTALVEGILASVVTGLGSVTLAFAILERVLPESVKISMEDEEWDPKNLELEEPEEKIQLVPTIIGIIFLSACLVLLNVFPDKVGYYTYLSTGEFPGWITIPALADVFFSMHLPLINIYLIGSMLLAMTLLILKESNRIAQIFDFALAVFGVVIVVRMMNGPNIFALGSASALSQDLVEVYETVSGIFAVMWQIGLVFILAGSLYGAVRKLFRIFDIRSFADLKRAARIG